MSFHPSSLAKSSVFDRYIITEMTLGRLGSWTLCLRLASNCLVHNAHQHNKWRMIVDLFGPRGQSVNDTISSDLYCIQYASADKVVSIGLLHSIGEG